MSASAAFRWLHPDPTDRRCVPAAHRPRRLSRSCFQSSGASARRVKASVSGRGKLLAATRDPATRSGGAQSRGQLIAQPGGIGENEPGFFRRRFQRLRRVGVAGCCQALRAKQPDLAFAACRADQPRQGGRFAETHFAASTRSHCARSSSGCSGRRSRSVKRHQPLVRPKTDSVHNCGVAMSMKTRLPPGASRSCRWPQRRAHIAHRVQHVGADDEIERARFEALLGARFFEIENLALDLRERPRAFAARRERIPRETSVKV